MTAEGQHCFVVSVSVGLSWVDCYLSFYLACVPAGLVFAPLRFVK